MNKKYNIDEIIKNIDFNSNKLNEIGRNILLSNREIEILERYKIDYKKCNSLKEILYEIEEILNDMDIIDEELELISESISERDYYMNTNK